MLLNYQIHKYKNGHQLIGATIQLDRTDQDTIDRLSDISGQLRPGETFDPYFTCYPLPSEKYFVIAKTWQDLSAPRAGCVLTKSIVLNMEDWESLERVESIFHSLDQSSFDLVYPSAPGKNNVNILGFDAPIEELVEALFLEQRKPILVVDSSDAEPLISRLYSVFWPGLRKKFAACTFALSPRSVNNRPFDLLFSTANMRTRFSDYTGRRIEGAQGNRKPGRHRWTKELTDRIFNNSEPSLYDKSSLSLFDFSSVDDESMLRLNLLWEELLEKAKFESSPTAILGLLDIINSQSVFAAELYKTLELYIRRSVNTALEKFNPSEAWRFYAGLLVKHKRKLMGRDLLLDVKYACTKLAIKDPSAALEFIVGFNPLSEKVPSILYASIGNGIAQASTENIKQQLKNVPAGIGLYLLATSRDFTKMVMTLIEFGEKTLVNEIERYLGYVNEKAFNRATNNLSLYITDKAHSSIAALLFKASSYEQFELFLSRIAENTRFLFREFDVPILKTAKKFDAKRKLLELLITYNEKGQADPLLLKMLMEDPQIIAEYVRNCTSDSIRRDDIICEVIDSISFGQLELLAKNKGLAKDLLSIIINLKKCDRNKVAEFILLADIPIGEAINSFNKLPLNVINSIAPDKLPGLVQKSFDKLSSGASRPFLAKLNVAQTDYIVQRLFDFVNDTTNLGVIFLTLIKTSATWKKSISKHIDIVSEALANYLPGDLEDEIGDNWIEVLRQANDFEVKRKAAFHMLSFVYKNQTKDPSKLLLASFPIVYDSFLTGRTLAQAIAYWVFPDWDKCKTLRYDLVERYLESKWPPLGIFQIAKKSGILRDVIYILSNSKPGRKFLEYAYSDSKDNPSVLDKATVKQIKKHIKDK